MSKKNRIVLALSLFFILILVIFKGDSRYLEERTADRLWADFLPTLNEIISKGDYIVYEFPNVNSNNKEKWLPYTDRLTYHIEIANLKNTPKMRKTFLLETRFRDLGSQNIVEFTIVDNFTKDIIEKKTLLCQPIKWLSILPVILALAIAVATGGVVVGLLVAVWLGSSLVHGASPFVGFWKFLTYYLPISFTSNNYQNLYLLLFLVSINLFIVFISYLGYSKAVANYAKSKFLVFLSWASLILHPYLFASIGTWLIKLKTNSEKLYRISCISHILSLTVPSLFLLSPFIIIQLLQINSSFIALDIHMSLLDIFLSTIKYRFFVVSCLSFLVLFLVFNREYGKISTKFFTLSLDLFKIKEAVRIKKILFVLSFIVLISGFVLTLIFSGIISVDFNNNIKAVAGLLNYNYFLKIMNKQHLYTYLIGSNVLAALFLSTIFCIVASLVVSYKFYLVKTSELAGLGVETKNYLSYIVILALSFCLREILMDLGTGYYILSLFNSRIDAMFFPVAAFVISSLVSICFGSSIASSAIILPVLLPIAKQLNGVDEVMLTTSAIIEGGIVGELLSPYSISSGAVSSILRLSPSRHIENQLPYVLIPFATAFVSGFAFAGTSMPFYLSYLLILIINFIIVFRRTNIRI